MPNPAKSIATRRFQCRHIFTDGHRCGSPCLRHENFCYYHHTTRRPQRAGQAVPHDAFLHPPNETSFTLPHPEDPSAIQHAIGEIMNQLARNALDPRRAGLLLYALQIASLNLQSAGRRNGPGHPNQAQPDNAPETVEDFTLDPELGPLAPQAEVGENQRRGSAFRLLQQLDQGVNQGCDRDFEIENAQQPGNISTLQAVANHRRVPRNLVVAIWVLSRCGFLGKLT